MKVVKMLTREAANNARNTDELKCASCGEIIDPDTNVYVYAIDGLTGYTEDGKQAFMDELCILPLCYHSSRRRENRTGTPNTTELRLGDISMEFELYAGISDPSKSQFERLLQDNEKFARVYISSLTLGKSASGHGQQSTADCTVTCETPLRNMDLYSPSAWLRNMDNEELAFFNNDHCGAHIHVNSNHACCNESYAIYREVLKRIEALTPAERVFWFGSDFRRYAGDLVGTMHNCAINYYPSTGCTIEFRLARVRNADQYIQCCKWWRATVDVVNKWFFKVESGEWTPEKLGKKAAKQFDRLMNGSFRKGE